MVSLSGVLSPNPLIREETQIALIFSILDIKINFFLKKCKKKLAKPGVFLYISLRCPGGGIGRHAILRG